MSVAIELIEDVFSIFDTDGDGKIVREKVPDLLRALGKAPNTKEAEAIVKKIKNEFITFDDLKAISREYSSLPTPDKLHDDMVNCFKACDKDGTGQVHEAELRQTLSTLGDYLTSSQVDDLLKEVTISANGQIDYDKLIDVIIDGYPVDD